MQEPVSPFAPEPSPAETPRHQPHPAQRFTRPEHVFDLQETLEELERGTHTATRGYRQKALFHHGPMSLIVFEFDSGAYLREHCSPGWVTIHVLDGALLVATPERAYDLDGGMILALDPDVPHSVSAREKSRMLLSMVRQKSETTETIGEPA